MKCSEKIRDLRKQLKLNQQELADLIGVSKRAVAAYESENARPRSGTLKRLAAVLKCSEEYLLNDDITDPQSGALKEEYIEEARALYGETSAKEVKLLLEQNAALFAGGTLSQEAKDAFFEAVMNAYISCKDEARKTYGKKADELL